MAEITVNDQEVDFHRFKEYVQDRRRLMGESGGDESGYIRQFGPVAGRQKYACDKADLSLLEEDLAQEATLLVMASLLEDS